ncbi:MULTISPECIES: hypothetical protein [unclassified Thioalkalivibrio]|uniref:hypothetical protein n=1 Tax=unclassified Thioalkalivibrio TaxID=2621013 RepID=UPI0003776890|nr:MULTISPECIES: hypothetical protein [unclassified Thioalkalivibrio]
MRTANRHTWLHALLVLSLVLAVPLLQGAGLHLHVGDHDHHDHPSPLHAAHDAEHVHHHDEAAEIDLTPQATGKPVTGFDLPGAALPTTAGGLSVASARAPPRHADLPWPHYASPPWLAPPLRGPPA